MVVAQLLVNFPIGPQPDDEQRHSQDAGIPQSQARADGHGGSFNTYPAPRTVWSSLGSKSASIFSRRRLI